MELLFSVGQKITLWRASVRRLQAPLYLILLYEKHHSHALFAEEYLTCITIMPFGVVSFLFDFLKTRVKTVSYIFI